MTERSVAVANSAESSDDVDQRNAAFWDELCGTTFARSLGLVGRDRATLEAFDHAYFAFYPYLVEYLDRFELAGRRVLEIGLGYGTLGEEMIRRGANYHGLDIAAGPVRMMQHRIEMLGTGAPDQIHQGSVLNMRFADEAFDFVYAIGVLHHTGDLRTSIGEVRRVLAPGGRAIVMVYNARSWRQIQIGLKRTWSRMWNRSGPSRTEVASLYDSDSSGASAPHTDYVSRRDVDDLFTRFAELEVRARNFDFVHVIGPKGIPRRWILGSPIEAWLGLDLYIVATREP